MIGGFLTPHARVGSTAGDDVQSPGVPTVPLCARIHARTRKTDRAKDLGACLSLELVAALPRR